MCLYPVWLADRKYVCSTAVFWFLQAFPQLYNFTYQQNGVFLTLFLEVDLFNFASNLIKLPLLFLFVSCVLYAFLEEKSSLHSTVCTNLS